MIHLYLSLGSNEGDRRAYLEAALSMLDEAFGTGYERLSSIVETPAWGFDGDDFLNCAVMYSLPRRRVGAQEQALGILDTVKDIEARLGRRTPPEYDER